MRGKLDNQLAELNLPLPYHIVVCMFTCGVYLKDVTALVVVAKYPYTIMKQSG